jgi:hypothetical protein
LITLPGKIILILICFFIMKRLHFKQNNILFTFDTDIS